MSASVLVRIGLGVGGLGTNPVEFGLRLDARAARSARIIV